ncbi:MAG: hypothetical protein ACJ78Q_17235 [Chloroflexia bacterium]
MDESTFLRRLAEFKAMPDRVIDVRDFQLVKTHPYPSEVKGAAFRALYAQASDEQRRRLPYLFLPGEPSSVYATDALCELFLRSDPDEQSRLLDSPVARSLDFGSIRDRIPLIKTPDDAEQLRKGLAAAVLLNGRDDYRDILMALAALWLAAARAGIDPLPYFQEASRLATTDDPRGIGSTLDELANFHNYAIFKEQVEPYLPGRPGAE